MSFRQIQRFDELTTILARRAFGPSLPYFSRCRMCTRISHRFGVQTTLSTVLLSQASISKLIVQDDGVFEMIPGSYVVHHEAESARGCARVREPVFNLDAKHA
jgi:hypothetical protein